MRSVLAILLLLFLIAGCAGGAPPPGPSAPAQELHVGFPKGGLADTIAIDAIERLPLRAAILVAPDGSTAATGYIDVTDTPRFATGQFAAGNPWRSALSGGEATAAPLPNVGGSAALQSQQQLLAQVSNATIALPDPVAYRRDWRKYLIRLTFGTPPSEVETRTLAAPEPPPPS